jgi:hypothetical protein
MSKRSGPVLRHLSLILLASLAASVSLAGCDLSSPTGPPGSTGTVSGRIQAVGGTPLMRPRALSGQVTLYGSGGKIATITVGANGRFSVPATVGTYTVSAQSPQYKGGTVDCHASRSITVTKGTTTKVDIDCQEK